MGAQLLPKARRRIAGCRRASPARRGLARAPDDAPCHPLAGRGGSGDGDPMTRPRWLPRAPCEHRRRDAGGRSWTLVDAYQPLQETERRRPRHARVWLAILADPVTCALGPTPRRPTPPRAPHAWSAPSPPLGAAPSPARRCAPLLEPAPPPPPFAAPCSRRRDGDTFRPCRCRAPRRFAPRGGLDTSRRTSAERSSLPPLSRGRELGGESGGDVDLRPVAQRRDGAPHEAAPAVPRGPREPRR